MKNIEEMIKNIDGSNATIQANTSKNFSICGSYTYNLAPSAIIYGNVIQLKTINVHSDYYHSVYVTYP